MFNCTPIQSWKDVTDDFSFPVVDSKDKKGKKDEKKKEKEKEKEKEKVKLYTALPELLLSFVYFDQNHTGYLLDKDVEEILHTLGLQLSRAQVRTMIIIIMIIIIIIMIIMLIIIIMMIVMMVIDI